MQFDYPLHDSLTVYDSSDGGFRKRELGDAKPFSEREIIHRNFLLSFEFEAGSTKSFVVRLKSQSSLRVGISLARLETFIAENDRDTAEQFIFYGLMIAMFLYNFLLLVTIRDKSYFPYLLYLLGHTLFQAGLSGILFQYLSPDYPDIASAAFHIATGITAIGIAFFARFFLETRKYTPRLNHALSIIACVGILNIILSPFLPYAFLAQFNAIFTISWAPVFLGIGLIRLWQGYRPAFLYLIAYTVFFVGVAYTAAGVLNLVSVNFFSTCGAQIGSAIEVILLSIALGSKINLERKNKYQAQAESLRHLKEKEHSFDQMAKVFYPHQLKKIREGEILEHTMPTHSSEAAVISFDIVGSSKDASEEYRQFMRTFLEAAQLIMMRGYQLTSLKSQGFRIKEMGDGFLCSVGYPFSCSKSMSVADTAVELAREFIKVFDEKASQFNFEERPRCGIGVAYGEITGFYPSQGTKEYDLYGRAIILAKRYEDSRHQLSRQLAGFEEAHLLIVSEGVQSRLSAGQQTRFIKHELTGSGFEVRDDPNAKALYYDSVPVRSQQSDLSTAS